jgi:hypothetical protein
MKGSIHQALKYMQSLVPASRTAASTDGTGIDCQGFEEALVIFDLNTIASTGTADVHVEESDDNSTFTDITSAVFSQKTAASDITPYVARIDLTKHARYLRAVLACDGSNAVIAGVAFLLGSPKNLPVTQANTVGFDV